MNYKVIDKEKYYRSGVFRHFTEDCKCSTSMTARVDVTELAAWSGRTGTRFYINFLYLLSFMVPGTINKMCDIFWKAQ